MPQLRLVTGLLILTNRNRIRKKFVKRSENLTNHKEIVSVFDDIRNKIRNITNEFRKRESVIVRNRVVTFGYSIRN